MVRITVRDTVRSMVRNILRVTVKGMAGNLKKIPLQVLRFFILFESTPYNF